MIRENGRIEWNQRTVGHTKVDKCERNNKRIEDRKHNDNNHDHDMIGKPVCDIMDRDSEKNQFCGDQKKIRSERRIRTVVHGN